MSLLHSAGDLTASEAASAYIDVTGSTIYYSLYTLNIRFPHTVAASVGMAHFDTESDALITKFTLSQLPHLPYWSENKLFRR